MPESTKPASPRQVALGVFILVQLAFLFLANVLGFVQWFPTLEHKGANDLINRLAPKFAEKQGNGWQWADQLEGNLRRYTELTGQDQSWSLFAPTVSKSTGFPALLLSWDDAIDEPGFRGSLFTYHEKNGLNLCGPWNHPPTAREPSLTSASQLGVLAAQQPLDLIALQAAAYARKAEKLPRTELVLSTNEPQDLHWYVRYSQARVRRFEGNFYFNPQPYDYENADTLGQRLKRRVGEFTGEYNGFVLVYMKWHLQNWRRDNPGAPLPKQVILLERFFVIHSPKETRGWDGPYVIPVARWLPELDAQKGAPTLESYDFTEQRFSR